MNRFAKRHETGSQVTTPSWFGSHSTMVVDHTELGLELSEDQVLLKDDNHHYITFKNRLDNGLADPNRSSSEATYDV